MPAYRSAMKKVTPFADYRIRLACECFRYGITMVMIYRYVDMMVYVCMCRGGAGGNT